MPRRGRLSFTNYKQYFKMLVSNYSAHIYIIYLNHNMNYGLNTHSKRIKYIKIEQMGQLESYTIQDIFLVAIASGVLSTYFAEEIEATIESVAAYTYSANFLITKKKVRIAVQLVSTGSLSDTRHASFNFLYLNKTFFLPIDRSLDSRPL